MPSFRVGDDDYECYRCGSNSIICGCDDRSKMEAEVKAVNVRFHAKRIEDSRAACEGALTYWVEDDKVVFARWLYKADGAMFIPAIIVGEEVLYLQAFWDRFEYEAKYSKKPKRRAKATI